MLVGLGFIKEKTGASWSYLTATLKPIKTNAIGYGVYDTDLIKQQAQERYNQVISKPTSEANKERAKKAMDKMFSFVDSLKED